MAEFLEKVFKLRENKTSARVEVTAGITTFMTMAYILAVNPDILGAAGMDRGAVFVATSLGAALGTLIMAFGANYPFALAPGMGLNAFFAYTGVGQMGCSWQTALAAVFVEGVIFIILSLTPVREEIFNCIPKALKVGISGGIGLYIAFIGLQNARIVVDGPCLVGLYPLKQAVASGEFHSAGVGALLALIGCIVTGILMHKKVPGDILLGILVTWGLGILCELTGIYIPAPQEGMFSLLPDFSNGFAIPSLAPTFMQMDFSELLTFNFITIMLTFMFVDLFDTLGTLVGVASRADMLDEGGAAGRLHRYRGRGSDGDFYCFNLRGKLGRSKRRRTHRPCLRSYGRTVSGEPAFGAAFSGDSGVCHGSGPDNGRLSDAEQYLPHRFLRLYGGNPSLWGHHRHAL